VSAETESASTQPTLDARGLGLLLVGKAVFLLGCACLVWSLLCGLGLQDFRQLPGAVLEAEPKAASVAATESGQAEQAREPERQPPPVASLRAMLLWQTVGLALLCVGLYLSQRARARTYADGVGSGA
jgi:hypothetical protein